MKASNKVMMNTAFLYGGLVVTVGVSLLSTRWVLEALGAEDYGIYSLIANMVSMFAFLNVAMAAATQRYLSFAMGEGKEHKVKETFYYSLFMHVLIGIIVLLLIEFGGYYFINSVLDIPIVRKESALDLLHCVAFSSLFTVLAVPYEGLLNAHEDMGVVASINIVDSLMKLAAAIGLFYISTDRLVFYGLFLLVTCIFTFLLKFLYCRRFYSESKFAVRRISDRKLFRQMLSFATWNLIGTGCGVARNQGVAVLLNLFWGVIANAAYGISQQVNGLLVFFSNTIVRAMRPQIIKSEGAGEHERMLRLSATACKMTFLLLSFLVVPLFIKTPFVLEVWLGSDYPADVVLFCRGFLIVTLINQLTIGLQIAIESTGRIRNLQAIVGSMHVLALPAGYICFLAGLPVSSIMLCIIAEETISSFIRIFLAHRIAGLHGWKFLFRLAVPCLAVVTISIALFYSISCQITLNEWIFFFLTAFLNVICISASAYFFCLTNEERTIFEELYKSIKRKIR